MLYPLIYFIFASRGEYGIVIMKQKYDIFVSYRRSSYDTANLIATRLKAAGYSVFFDMETLRSGKFNEQLYEVIDNCTDFLVVLPPQALDRCVNEDDWVRLEVCRAMAHNKNIIPVMLNGFTWPSSMPQGMEELCNYQALTASSIEYFDLALQRLQERYLLSKRHRSAKKTMMWTGVGLCSLAIVVAIGLFVFRIIAKGVCEDYATRMTNHTSRIHILAEENVRLGDDWDKFLKTWDRKASPEARLSLRNDFLARLDVAEQNVAMLIPDDTLAWQISGYDRFLLSLHGINGAELALYPQMTKLYLTDYIESLNIYRQFLEDDALNFIETDWGSILFEVHEHSINSYYASYLSIVTLLPDKARRCFAQQSAQWIRFPNYASDGTEKYYEDIIIKEGQLTDELMARYERTLQYAEAEMEEMDAQLDELERKASEFDERTRFVEDLKQTNDANQQELAARQANVQAKEALVDAKKAELRELDRKHIELYEELKAKDRLEEEDDQWYQWGKITHWATYMNTVVQSRQELLAKGVRTTSSITPELLYADLSSMLSVYQTYHPEAKDYVASAKVFYREVSRAKLPFAGVMVFAFKDDAVHDFLQVGDIIIVLNGIPVKNYDALKAAFKTEDGDGSMRFLRLEGKELIECRRDSYGDTSIVGFLNLTD